MKTTTTLYDVIIIGAGPAGITAGIYAWRSGLKVLIIESEAPGGKLLKTHRIENWTGDKMISGLELAERMYEHSKEFEIPYEFGRVANVINHDLEEKEIILDDGKSLKSRTLIVATGMNERIPSIEGIKKFNNKGVSYCIICDGPLYRGKDTIVIGGGNSAIEESIFLSRFAKSVEILVRNKEDLVADKIYLKEIKAIKNIKLTIGEEIVAIKGKEFVEEIAIKKSGSQTIIRNKKVSAIFPYIGLIPATSFLNNLNILDSNGFIIVDHNMETKIKNIYGVGDVNVKDIRQIVTAVSDGAIASKNIAMALKH